MVTFRRGIPITDPTASLGRGLGQGTRRTEAGGFTEYLPFSVRNSILCNDFHPWNFGFVWSLFHLQVSAGQASRVPNLRVVLGRAAVAACAASDLSESRLTLSVYATRHGLCVPDPSFWRTRWPVAARHNCNGFANNAGCFARLHGGGAKMSAGSSPVRPASTAWASARNATSSWLYSAGRLFRSLSQ